MNILLTTEVRKVGHKDQLVTVADGYAMNYLIPRHMAVQATTGVLTQFHDRIKSAQAHEALNAEKAKALLAQLEGKVLTIAVVANDSGTLFKALHESDIVDEIKKQWGIEVPESAITLHEPIKKKGTYHAPVTIQQTRVEVEVVV